MSTAIILDIEIPLQIRAPRSSRQLHRALRQHKLITFTIPDFRAYILGMPRAAPLDNVVKRVQVNVLNTSANGAP
jgi:hypothetical protein